MKKIVLVIILVSLVSLLFAYGGRVKTETDTGTIELGTNLADISQAAVSLCPVTVGEYYRFGVGSATNLCYYNDGTKGSEILAADGYFTATTYDSVGVYGDCSGSSVRAKVEDWTEVDRIDNARYDSFAFLIYTDPTDSVVAYRVKGFPDAASTYYYFIEDSARATGSDGTLFEWDPSNFSKVILEFYEISDSTNWSINNIMKNPYE